MIVRRHIPLQLLSSLLLLSFAWAQDNEPFDCKVSLDDLKYDLTGISGERAVSRERDTPPTKMRDTLRFNLCADLKKQDGIADEDQVSTIYTSQRQCRFETTF